jgi:hypothetical protein
MRQLVLFLLFCLYTGTCSGQANYKIGKLKYGGGGDWYANKTSLPNLIQFCNQTIKTQFDPDPQVIEPGSSDLLGIPIVHATGHGNMIFTPTEAANLRKYLVSGGFLHFDDNYGFDPFIRREMKKVFPEAEFVELPFSHAIYHQKFDFPLGLPKIHEHDKKPPQGFGLFYQGRMVCFYSYECDLGNGWEDQAVYKDPEATRLLALRMGANIVTYALSQP